ncbi:hypothetical protein BJ165DRAFT_1475085 [Panaeolus papilionaceus]|nr:hypothetical protein BJ165DRAFT_1475085 [Panaeolus papilionaceus]
MPVCCRLKGTDNNETGTLPKKSDYRNDLRRYALPAVVGQNRRTLKEISIAEHGLRGCSETTIEVLHDALRNIRKDNVLETILLDLSFDLTDMNMLRKPFDQWRRMATLLVDKPENFPCIKKVDILVCLQGSSAVFSGRNKRDLEGFLLEPLWQLLTTTNFSAHCKVSVKEV